MQPNAFARLVQRSPNLPAVSTRTSSPGLVRLLTVASIAPVPDDASTTTSFCGSDEELELLDDFLIEGSKLRRAMMQVRRRHGELGVGQQRGRAGSIKTRLAKHEDHLGIGMD